MDIRKRWREFGGALLLGIPLLMGAGDNRGASRGERKGKNRRVILKEKVRKGSPTTRSSVVGKGTPVGKGVALNGKGNNVSKLKAGTVREVPGLPGARVVYIPPGSFLMGSPSEEHNRDFEGEIQHRVRLTRGFWMWETEVTQGQFKIIMGYNPSHFKKCGSNCPVENVSWHEAVKFASELSEKMGLESCFECSGKKSKVVCKIKKKYRNKNYYNCKGWRLPTEAEWEYAYRAGTATPFYTGWCISPALANFESQGSYIYCPGGVKRKGTIRVKSFPPNRWGLYDMAGNVWEWVVDWYGLYTGGVSVDPVNFDLNFDSDRFEFTVGEGVGIISAGDFGSERGYKVKRGGSWVDFAKELRAANRGKERPLERDSSLGFRLVKSEGRGKILKEEKRPLPTTRGSTSKIGIGRSFLPRTDSLKKRGKFFQRVGTVIKVPGLPSARVVYIPPGSFIMGSPPKEVGRDNDEVLHRVKLTRGFWMWETEVTQGQFEMIMGYNPSHFKKCGTNCPVERVNWHEAAGFANELSKKMGLESCFECTGINSRGYCKLKKKYRNKNYYNCKGWRLPTEAEWEYAYRAGTTTPFYTGESITIKQANFNRNREKTSPVKSFPPNRWGLYDMAGNVWELVVDAYGDYPTDAINPVNLSDSYERVSRGGAWSSERKELRAANRQSISSAYLDENFGFRLVISE